MDKFGTELAAPAEVSAAPKRNISPQARYHGDVRRKVLAANPHLAGLAGADWRTAIAAIALLAIHWTTAWAVSRTNWWTVFLVAFFFGQFVYHAAATLVHESAHRLVFRNPKLKLAFDLVQEATLTSFSNQLTYQRNHVTSHHPSLGDYDGDYEHEDLYRVAARKAYRAQHPVKGRLLSALQLALHLLPYGFICNVFMPRIYAKGTGLPRGEKSRDVGASKPSIGERRLFFFFSLAVWIGLYLCFGFLGFLYHLWSMSLVLGRWGISSQGQFLSEHPGDDTEAPTRSTYWWGNRISSTPAITSSTTLFPNVPWTRIRKVRAAAPDVFNVANKHAYFGLWWAQLKSDFSRPVRASARDNSELLRRHMPDATGIQPAGHKEAA